MLKLYVWKTPNGFKAPIMLEECGMDYEIIPINISKGEQKTPEYLAINPNGKIPALVDEDAEGGPVKLFESGAILLYLAEKSKKFIPQDMQGKYSVVEWLMFQMAGVGPMFGQYAHFTRFAPEKVPYAISRYHDESVRLLGVLDTRLGEADYLAGEYSIADISTYPWVKAIIGMENSPVEGCKNVERWLEAIESRPAVKTAYEKIEAACQ
jgi:GST-like protein